MIIKINGKPIIQKVKHEFKTYELIPTPSTRNYQTNLLGKLIASFYRTNQELTSFNTNKAWLEIKDTYKVNFKVFMTKESIKFYLSVPTEKSLEFERKVASVFNNQVSMVEVKDLPSFDASKCYCAEIGYSKNDIFSLQVDSKETSAPLSSILSTVKILEQDDMAMLDILVEPINPLEWKYEAKQTHNQLDRGIVPHGGMGNKIFKLLYDLINSLRLGILSMTRVNKQEEQVLKQMMKEESSYQEAFTLKEQMTSVTKKKQHEEVVSTLIRVVAQSEDKERRISVGHTLGNAFADIAGDNQMQMYHIPQGWTGKYVKDIEDKKFTSIRFRKDKLSTHEVGKLLQMPGKELILEYKQINSNCHKEIDLPNEITQEEIKAIELGTVTEKGLKKKVRIPLEAFGDISQKEVDNCVATNTIISGPKGTGKTNSGITRAVDQVCAGQTTIVIDTADGEMLKDIANTLPEDFPDHKIHVLDFDNKAYPIPCINAELGSKLVGQHDELEALEVTENFTTSFIDFINSETSSGELTDRMKQFTVSALKAVSTQKVFSYLDLELCLTSPAFREGLLARPEVQSMPEVAQDLEYLQSRAEEGKEGVIIDPIISRLKLLSGSKFMQNLFYQAPKVDKNGEQVLNLRKILDNVDGGYGHLVLIQCGYTAWKSYQSTILGFWHEKIAYNIYSRADQLQKDRKMAHVIIDEPHKFIRALQGHVSSSAVEYRKYRASQTFLVHSLNQMELAKEALLSGGVQLINFKTENLDELKKYFYMFSPFDDPEALYSTMPSKHKALVHLKLPSGKPCPAFLCDMTAPYKPVKDRSYLWLECSKKYGQEWKQVMQEIDEKRSRYRQLDREWIMGKHEEKQEKKTEKKTTEKKPAEKKPATNRKKASAG